MLNHQTRDNGSPNTVWQLGYLGHDNSGRDLVIIRNAGTGRRLLAQPDYRDKKLNWIHARPSTTSLGEALQIQILTTLATLQYVLGDANGFDCKSRFAAAL